MTQQRVSEILAKWKFDPSSTTAGVGEINKLNSALQEMFASGLSVADALTNPAVAAALNMDAEKVSEINKRLLVTTDTAKALGDELNRAETVRTGLLKNLSGTGDTQATTGFMRDLVAIQGQEATARQKNLDISRMMTEELEKQVAVSQTQANITAGAITSRLNAMQGQQLIASTAETASSFAGGLRQDAFGASGAGASVGSNLYRAGRQLFLLPNVNITSGFSSTDLSRGMILTGGVADKLNLSMGKLALGFGLVGGAIGVVILAVSTVVNVLNKAAQAEKERFEQIAKTSKEVVDDSNEELRIKRAQAAQAAALEEANHARLLARQAELQGKVNNFSPAAALANPGETLVELYTKLGANAGALQESEKALADNTKQVDAYTEAINDNYTAAGELVERINQQTELAIKAAQLGRSSDVQGTNDQIIDASDTMRAAGDSLVEIDGRITAARLQGNEVQATTLEIERVHIQTTHDQAEADLHLLQRMLPVIQANYELAETQRLHTEYINAETDALIAVDGLTKKEREERIAAINREVAIRTAAQAKFEEGTEEFLAMGSAIQALRVEADILNHSGETAADIADRLERQKEQNDELLETMDLLAEATENLNKLQTELTEAEQEHKDKSAAIDQDYQDKQDDALDKRDRDLGRLRRETARDLGRALEDIERQSNRRIAEIKAQGTRKLEDLIAHGDQAAAIQALADMQFQIEQEKKKRGEAEDDRREQTEQQLDDQQERIEEAYRDQLAAADRAHDRAIEQEEIRWRKEEQARQAAIRQALVDQQNANAALLNIQNAMHAAGNFNEQYWANARLSIVNQSGVSITDAFRNMMNNILRLATGNGGGGNIPPPSSGPLPPAPPGSIVPIGAPFNPKPFEEYRDPTGQWWIWVGNHWQKAYHGSGSSQSAPAAFSSSQTAARSFGDIPAGDTGSLDLRTLAPRAGGQNVGSVNDNTQPTINIFAGSMDEQKLAAKIRGVVAGEKSALVSEISAEMAKIRANEIGNVYGRRA